MAVGIGFDRCAYHGISAELVANHLKIMSEVIEMNRGSCGADTELLLNLKKGGLGAILV